MKKAFELDFDGVNYKCSLEEENKENINIEIKNGDFSKFNGKISLKDIYNQIPAFDEYTMEEFFSAAGDLTKDKIKLSKSSENKYELDLAFKVLKKEKHLIIQLSAVIIPEDEMINRIVKILENNDKKIEQLEKELSQLKKEFHIDNKPKKEIDVKSANEWKEKGNALVKEQKYKEALDCYSKSIEYNPNEPILYSNRSAMYLNLSQYDLALKDAEKAIELKPDYVKPYLRKGKALEGLNKKKEALAVYELGLEKDKNDAQLKQAVNELKNNDLSKG